MAKDLIVLHLPASSLLLIHSPMDDDHTPIQTIEESFFDDAQRDKDERDAEKVHTERPQTHFAVFRFISYLQSSSSLSRITVAPVHSCCRVICLSKDTHWCWRGPIFSVPSSFFALWR